MSTKKKVIVTTTPRAIQTSAQRAKSSISTAKNTSLIFGRTNYMLMLVGLVLIAVGLMLMSGGAMPDPNTWDESLIYSGRRIIFGPLVILLGLVIEIVAIFKSAGFEESATVEDLA
ncbi:MAG: DUF3098 domain-containing protein [Bacteroidetes bacterium]|nr:DUF3098 domain-containing protein [Bacteroidota bacterium]